MLVLSIPGADGKKTTTTSQPTPATTTNFTSQEIAKVGVIFAIFVPEEFY